MRNYDTPTAVGGSSLFVIFAVLCLTILAVLGISTVQADGRLMKASAESVSAYYEADCEAEAILAELRSGNLPAGVVKNDNCYSYQCVISDVLLLDVEVSVNGDAYKVLRWQVVSTTDWQQEDSMQVWDGDV